MIFFSDCARLPRPKNGILSSTVVKHGSSVTVSCNSGYTLSGERILVCSSGSWSGRIGTCEAGMIFIFKSCPDGDSIKIVLC